MEKKRLEMDHAYQRAVAVAVLTVVGVTSVNYLLSFVIRSQTHANIAAFVGLLLYIAAGVYLLTRGGSREERQRAAQDLERAYRMLNDKRYEEICLEYRWYLEYPEFREINDFIEARVAST